MNWSVCHETDSHTPGKTADTVKLTVYAQAFTPMCLLGEVLFGKGKYSLLQSQPDTSW